MGESDINDKKSIVWLYIAVNLGFIIFLSTLLNILIKGLPLGFILPLFNEPATLSSILYHVSIIVAGAYIGYLGVKELIVEKRFSIEFLMSVAGFGALYLDLLFEGVTVLFLYSLAEYFESYIENRAKKTIEGLSEYMPEKVRIIKGNVETILKIEEVKPGMLVLVKPGERIPLDGIIYDGFSYIDQSPITGESIPVLKKTGDEVYGGTLNLDGILKIKVTKSSSETIISKIVKLVMESKKRKSHIEKLVDRVAKFYVPLVILLALFTAAFVPIITGGSFNTWLYRSLILLVIACPSAFLVSVPATFFTAITIMARRGVIIKGSAYLEKLAKVNVAMFDKTGTLTLGKLTVIENCPSSYIENYDETLRYIAALERYSNHPIAEAIVKKVEERGLSFHDLYVKNVKEIPGKGIMGDVNGIKLFIGNIERINSINKDGHTKVYVSMNGRLVAELCLSDQIRDDAITAVAELKKLGIHTIMLTGDKWDVAKEITREINVDEVYAELLPEDKLRILKKFQEKYGQVMMVGDGINDAPALAASDVGIAMGSKGLHITLESADIVLVKDELTQVPQLIRIGKLASKIAKQNVVISLGTKLLLGILGFLGLIPLWSAVAIGDDGITALLFLNILRLTKM